MKVLTCKMCGSTDVIMQDGLFVCQSCGTKYSNQEIEQIMAKDLEDRHISIKLDVSEKLKNLYIMARRAKENCNIELAAKYYEMIALENPMDWEAVFYFSYFKARSTNLMNMEYSALQLAQELDTIFHLINISNIDADEKWLIAKEIDIRINILCNTWIVWARSHYRQFSNVQGTLNDLVERAVCISKLKKKMADSLEKYFSDASHEKIAKELNSIIVDDLKSYVRYYLLLDVLNDNNVEKMVNNSEGAIEIAEEKIKRLDPSYESVTYRIKKEEEQKAKTNKHDKAVAPWTFGGLFIGALIALIMFLSMLSNSTDNIIGFLIGVIGAPILCTLIGRLIGESKYKKK